MRPFAYCAPRTLGEAVALLAQRGERARPLAGGTDLLVRLRLGTSEADIVVDLKGISELNALDLDASEGLTIGAAVPCCRIAAHPGIAAAYPGLVDAVSIIGGAAIQSRATLGGNLCNAAPSADSIPALIVLGARCTIAGPHGTRSVPAEQFCTAPGQTVLGRDELLVSLHLPSPRPNTGARYLRFTPRGEMDLAVVGVGAWLALDPGGGAITGARIAVGAVAPTPLFVRPAGEALLGMSPTEESWAKAALMAQEMARPISDVRGTAAQRRHLVGVLTVRALRGALARARGGNGHVVQG